MMRMMNFSPRHDPHPSGDVCSVQPSHGIHLPFHYIHLIFLCSSPFYNCTYFIITNGFKTLNNHLCSFLHIEYLDETIILKYLQNKDTKHHNQ